MDRPANIELIKGYFNGTLTESQLVHFRDKMQNDASFRRDVSQYEYIFGNRLKKGEKGDVLEYHFHRKKSNLPKLIKRASLYILPLVLIVLVVVNYSSKPKIENSEQLFLEYFEPYPNIINPTTRSSELDSTVSLHVALRDYELGDYELVIEKLSQLGADDQYRDEILFYKAMSLMAMNNSRDAVHNLRTMSLQSPLENQRKWYLALAYLHLEELEEAVEVLNEIIESQSYYLIYAQELLDKFHPEN